MGKDKKNKNDKHKSKDKKRKRDKYSDTDSSSDSSEDERRKKRRAGKLVSTARYYHQMLPYTDGSLMLIFEAVETGVLSPLARIFQAEKLTKHLEKQNAAGGGGRCESA
jgi:hypothetical protein